MVEQYRNSPPGTAEVGISLLSGRRVERRLYADSIICSLAQKKSGCRVKSVRRRWAAVLHCRLPKGFVPVRLWNTLRKRHEKRSRTARGSAPFVIRREGLARRFEPKRLRPDGVQPEEAGAPAAVPDGPTSECRSHARLRHLNHMIMPRVHSSAAMASQIPGSPRCSRKTSR